MMVFYNYNFVVRLGYVRPDNSVKKIKNTFTHQLSLYGFFSKVRLG